MINMNIHNFITNFLILSTLPPLINGQKQSSSSFHFQHIGCYKAYSGDGSQEKDPDLKFKSIQRESGQSIKKCIYYCTSNYYKYAGLSNGSICSCGSSYGRNGPSNDCQKPCADNSQDFCGGNNANVVYKTGINVPGPITELKLESSQMHQLSISWESPISESENDNFIKTYFVRASINDSFDPSAMSRFSSPKQLSFSGSTRSATILGLEPGVKYNITVIASASDSAISFQKSKIGPGKSMLFWTEIGKPEVPETPVLIHHADDHDGEIHVRIKPLKGNRYGPISGYWIVVLDETDQFPFYPDSLTDWSSAQEKGLNYWIAAEVDENYFKYHDEFVVGDGKYYGDYFNYGPLPFSTPDGRTRDYHVTVGAVSTLNNVTKISYARVNHDQHASTNVVVFDFHDHDNDHHDHHSHGENIYHDHEDEESGSNALEISLIIMIVIFGFILAGIVGLYVYLRFFRKSRSGSRGDVQELTTRNSSVLDFENELANSNHNIAAVNGFDYNSQDAMDGPVSSASQIEAIRRQVWAIPKNFLDLSNEIVGRGKFGSVVKGIVNKKGLATPAKIHVIPAKILEENERRFLGKDLELVVRHGSHVNLIQLIGLCDDPETLFVVLEDAPNNFKQILIDSRALVHYPVYAQKNNRFSTLREDNIMEILVGIASGMAHLAKNKIFHKRLCCNSIYLISDNIPKISGIGIADFSTPGIEYCYTRWSASETFQSKQYITKCDVWSYGVIMWEAIALGGTPYVDVREKELPSRVQRGLRLEQMKYLSDELYQIMLQCWQFDVDERPTFEELVTILTQMSQQGLAHINFSLEEIRDFNYEKYTPEQEMKITPTANARYV